MPRRTNEFQRLIALIESQLAPDAHVRESVLLKDSKTGEDREVDVLIDAVSGIHPVRIAVECQDRGRPSSEEWIDQLHGRYRDLEIDKVIAVARGGFTSGARRKAEAVGIEILTLDEANATDWEGQIAEIEEIEGVEVDVVVVSASLTVEDADAPMMKELSSAVDKLLVYDETGESLGSVGELVARVLLEQPDVVEGLEKKGVGEPLRYEAALQLDRAFLRSDSGEKQRLYGGQVLIAFTSRRVVNEPIRRATYGEAQVVHGSLELGGKQVDLALVVKPGFQGHLGFTASERGASKESEKQGPDSPPPHV